MTTTISTQASLHNEQASRVEVRLTKVEFVNPWGSLPPLERTYGSPRPDGFGARRAVKKYNEALRRLAD